MPDFTPEQLEKIRFLLDNWHMVELFERKKLFIWKNGWIKINYRPKTGEVQNFEYFHADYEK